MTDEVAQVSIVRVEYSHLRGRKGMEGGGDGGNQTCREANIIQYCSYDSVRKKQKIALCRVNCMQIKYSMIYVIFMSVVVV